jgi:tetratricopeptide (TPR) repeat protein
MSANIPVVMISSTVCDLPEHRRGVEEACLRQDMFPKMMEHSPAANANGLAQSKRMVDAADVYLGIFAHRYGHVPKGKAKSITHYEYEWATQRRIPRLIFIMHEDHLIKRIDVELGKGQERLERLKAKLKTTHAVNFFKSPDDLRGLVIATLAAEKTKLVARSPAGGPVVQQASTLHNVSDIPAPPEPYIAHPYTLLHANRFVGRRSESKILRDWVAGRGALADVRVLCVVALGGMGKSALTWAFFNETLPRTMKPLAGRIWWSFYESNAGFENFVTDALAYVSGKSRQKIKRNLTLSERETELLAHLRTRPHFIVLDGLERILKVYAGVGVDRVSDENYDDRTANYVVRARNRNRGAAPAFVVKSQLRAAADVRVGRFLRKLAALSATGSKVLVSTRLYPADLQLPDGQARPGCHSWSLTGMTDDDALELWRAHGAGGSRESLLPIFNSFKNHPLLLQALAGVVGANHGGPGDFDHWRSKRRDFDPLQIAELAQVQAHILEHALRDLEPAQLEVLNTLSAFRMPASYDTLVALLVRPHENGAPRGKKVKKPSKINGKDSPATRPRPFADQVALDRVLTVLDDRGLLGWDSRPRVNRFDLHPIVRRVVWDSLKRLDQDGLYSKLVDHFGALGEIESEEVKSIDDLTPAIGLYHALIGLGQFDGAFKVFRDRLSSATLRQLAAHRERCELLDRLFPDGRDASPRLADQVDQLEAINEYAHSLQFSGQPQEAARLFHRAAEIAEQQNDPWYACVEIFFISHVERIMGRLRQAEHLGRKSLVIARKKRDRFLEWTSLLFLGLDLSCRYSCGEGERAFRRSRKLSQMKKDDILSAFGDELVAGIFECFAAQGAAWCGDFAAVAKLARQAWSRPEIQGIEFLATAMARLEGTSAVFLGKNETADERLHYALTHARAANLVEEEIASLISLAELHRRLGEPERARELLDDVWEGARLGPYPLLHADALNALAMIERDARHRHAAVEAATESYRLAWCDGPPFAYHSALVAASAHLEALHATPP